MIRRVTRLLVWSSAILLVTSNAISPSTVSAAARIVARDAPIVTAISAGWGHTCALLADHTVRCWGDNSDGQLGDGTTTDQLVPANVVGIKTATAISAGGDHTCALLADHTIRCWGDNSDGQLGDGTTVDRHTPVAVSGISTAVGVAASDGWGHTCAPLVEGTVRCWGNNTIGQLGDHTWVSKHAPVDVVETAVHHPSAGLLGGVASIAVGGNITCGLLKTGGLACWGNSSNGQLGGLGHDTWTSSNTPVAVGGIRTAIAVATGLDHACAVLADAYVRCWGANANGQLGQGTSDPDRNQSPLAVPGISTATAIAARGRHTCVRLDDGGVRCWGGNGSGELGDGTTTQRSTPVAVAGIDTASAISTGSSHTCALLTDGTVRCWGRNDSGQLGDGSTIDRHAPVAVVIPPATPFTDIAGSPFKPDIEWVYTEGITTGCTATAYCPDGYVTREQMASFLARALKLSGTAPDAFTDDESSIHEPNINLVAKAGIATGCAPGKYCPTGLVSREQMASFLASALKLAGSAPDAFTDDETSIHEPNINLVAKAGVATGCGDGKYCPTANVTRGQMAAFLHRAFGP